MERSRAPGFKVEAGIRYVYDLLSDAYVPVETQALRNGPEVIPSAQLGKVAIDSPTLPRERLTKREQAALWPGEKEVPSSRHTSVNGIDERVDDLRCAKRVAAS